MDLSVAICAYNAAQRIEMVLESLGRQSIPEELRWELIVVDNASTDGTGALVASLSDKYGLPLRLLSEPSPGLANARRCAAIEARSDLLSYLDDDVVVPENWVVDCVRFLRSKPTCGIMGCKVVPLFEDETAKPPDFDHWYAGILSMIDLGPEVQELDVRNGPKVVGAGMSGRTSLFRTTFAKMASITGGRKGSSLAGGEDFESQLIASRLGWEIWYTPTLVLQHYVPVRKLNRQYLEKWFIDTAACHAWLNCLSTFDRPPTSFQLISRAATQIPMLGRLAIVSWLPWRDVSERRESWFWARQCTARAMSYFGLLSRRSDMERVYRLIDESRSANVGEMNSEPAVL